MRRRWLLLSTLGLCAAMIAALGWAHRGESALPFYNTAALMPEWHGDSSHHIADFAFVDQQGNRFNTADVAGKIYVASFFYTACRDLCPKLRSNLTRVQAAFADNNDVLIVSHTVAPENDDSAMLRRYAEANHINAKRWKLLTGDRAELTRLARDSYFVRLADTATNGAGTLVHTETVVLVDGQHRIRGVYDGSLPYDVDRMIGDIRTLLKR